MANTKNITDRTDRKNEKRKQRKALKDTFAGLSPKDRTKFRKSETVGLRKWIGEQDAE
jgi:hypothetical protein